MGRLKGKIRDESRLTVVSGQDYPPDYPPNDDEDAIQAGKDLAEALRSLVNPQCSLIDLKEMMDREDYQTIMNRVGIKPIVENIARGVSPITVADTIGVTITNFIRWIKKDSERESLYKEAKELSATTLRHGAITACTLTPETPADYAQQKLFIDTSLKVANAIDPISAAAGQKELMKVYLSLGFEKKKSGEDDDKAP